jgi:carboxypeptidase C (cathepsin A)
MESLLSVGKTPNESAAGSGTAACWLRGLLLAVSTLILTLPGGWLAAAEEQAKPPPAVPSKESTPPISTTRHALTLNGQKLDYSANAGFLQLADEAGKARADVFFVAYTKEPAQDPANRPITFAFNGGPGASSAWVHLGALGPKRVVFGDDGKALPTSCKLVDNDQSWLDVTDLVFIDPVGTGFSRAATGVDAKQFYSVKGDVESVAEFIRLYITRYERWLSPMYLAGESYGTTRAVGLAGHLQQSSHINPAGLVLISCALDFQTIAFDPHNDLPFVLYLPSLTAAAAYHRKLPPDLPSDQQKLLAEVEEWALGPYLAALAKGDALSADERGGVAARLARYTGLDPKDIERQNLRISNRFFARTLLRDGRLQVGLMDGRVTGIIAHPGATHDDSDPSLFITEGPLATVLNDYVRRELKFDSARTYEMLSGQVNGSWRWETEGQGFLNVSGELTEAMSRDPRLRVLVANGIYDLVTAYCATKYTFNHLALDKSLRANVKYAYYQSGHQMYTHLPALKSLKDDVSEFMRKP